MHFPSNSAPMASEMTATATSETLKQLQENDTFSDNSKSDQVHVENENSAGYATPQVPKEAQQLAKGANVKNWACANFSSIGGEELLRFLHSLSRTCVDIGMDFALEPAMMVCMCSPCDADIEHCLMCVHEFFGHPEIGKGQTKFLLVILPDARCYDEFVEETCKEIRVVYQCCLPLYNRMVKKEYLRNAATEIKAKVIEFNELSNSRKDMDIDELAESYSDYEEMTEDGGSHEEETEDDDDDHNESREYDCEEKRSEARKTSDYPKWEMSKQRLFPDDDFTIVNDAILKGKCVSTKTWACVNFSSIRGKRLFRFLSKLGNMCLSIGMDLSLEPAMSIHIETTHEIDITASLLTVFEFFRHLKIERRATLLLVILPEAIYAHASVREVCENLGFVYHFCAPWRVRRASEKYLKNAANKIKAKVHEKTDCQGLYSSELYSDDPEELYCSDKDAGEDAGSETSDEDPVEIVGTVMS